MYYTRRRRKEVEFCGADLTYSIFIQDQLSDNHLLSDPLKFAYMTELSNSIAHLNHILNGSHLSEQEKIVRYLESVVDINETDHFLSFVLEQMKLVTMSPSMRRYTVRA